MKENIRNVVAGRIETGKLVVNGITYSPQWSVGHFIYSGGKAGRKSLYMFEGGIVENKRNVVKHKFIRKRIEVNSRCQENQAQEVENR